MDAYRYERSITLVKDKVTKKFLEVVRCPYERMQKKIRKFLRKMKTMWNLLGN